MKMKLDIITFGSAVVDVFIHTEVAEKKNQICYPTGGKILINELKFDIGGGGTNTAVAFSRFGLKTGCICNVGGDENGNKILSLLKKENVKFLGKIDKSGMTGYSVILDSKGGERTILTYKGVNNNIAIKDIESISSGEICAKWLYYSALLGKSFLTQKSLAFILHKKGVKIAFNPSSYIINNEDISGLLKICEVLILNHEEAYALYKRYHARGKLLEGLYSLGPKIIVITNKDKETWCYDGRKKYSIMPHKNIKVVERTGAGDAFASGFVAGRITGLDIMKCLELGLKESESVITSRGAKNKLLRMNLKG
jgi:ribokinase